MEKALNMRDLALSCAAEGRAEEYFQKQHNYTMYDHHKAQRLRLEAEYRRRLNQGEPSGQIP